MKITFSLVLPLLLATTLLAGASAEQTRSIQLEVSGITLSTLATNFAEMADATLDAPDGLLARTVSVSLEDVRWQTALSVVCDLAACTWTLSGEADERTLRLQVASAEEEGPLSERVTIHTNAADGATMLESLARVQGMTVQIDPQIEGTVTTRVGHVRLRTALDVICDSVGCHWLIEDGTLVVHRREPVRGDWPASLREAVDLSLLEADACAVTESLARIAGLRFDCGEALAGRAITIEAQKLPVSAVLDHVAERWSSRWHVEADRLVFEPLAESDSTGRGEDWIARLEQKVSLDLVQAEACDVLAAIGSLVELDVTCHDFLASEQVSVTIESVSARDLLDQLCDQWRCHWSVGARGLFLETRD